MKKWKTYKLSDFIHFNPTLSLKKGTIAKKITMDQLIPYSREIYSWVNEPYSGGAKFQNGDTIMARITPCLENGKHAYVSILDNNEIAYGSTEYFVMRGIEGVSDNLFVYYLTHYPEFKNAAIKSMVGSSGRQRAQLDILKNLEYELPDLDEQIQIATLLSSIDDKIALNKRINDNLEQQARELFKSWFINSPQESWKEKSLSDYFNVITGKKDANYSTPEGAYPFFTCSQDILKAPSYSFDGHAILVAGNGDFNVKRYIGKFEAYQRTYVLIPHEEKFHAFLYLMIDYYLPEITGGSRGSVIKFITKGNIANFRFRVPQNNIDDQLKKLNDIYKIIDCNLEESSRLTKMRDTLLPKLMSGELKINEIDC